MSTYKPSEADINELQNTRKEDIDSTNFCKQLKVASALNLSNINMRNIPDELIKNIADVIVKSERIHTVNMSYTKHNQDTLISVLKTLASSNTIHTLSLSNVYFYEIKEAVDVANALATFPNLRSLDLSKSLVPVYLNMTEIVAALTTSRSLEELIIDYNPAHYDAQGLSEALARIPNLEILSMYGCDAGVNSRDAGVNDAVTIARNLTSSRSLRSVDMGLSSGEAAKVFAEYNATRSGEHEHISYNVSYERGFGHRLVNEPNGLCVKYENFPFQRAVEDAWEQQAQAEAAEPLQAAGEQAQADAGNKPLEAAWAQAQADAAGSRAAEAAEPLQAAGEQAQAEPAAEAAHADGSPAAYEAAHDERGPAAHADGSSSAGHTDWWVVVSNKMKEYYCTSGDKDSNYFAPESLQVVDPQSLEVVNITGAVFGREFFSEHTINKL